MSDKIPEILFPAETRFVDLPSKGNFYPIGHPLYGQSAVEVFHMRGQEEDILTNLDYLRRGLTLDRLVQSLLVNPELKKQEHYDRIIAADRNAILLDARIIAYTWEYPVSIKCPSCNNSAEFTFDLRQAKSLDGNTGDGDRVQYLPERNTFLIVFEGGTVVEVRPKTIDIENKITRKLANKKKKDITNKDLYEDMIVEINGMSHPKLTEKFFSTAPAKFLNWFKKVIYEINPDVDLSQTFECSHCNHEETIDPPFTTDFLFPKTRKRKKVE